MTRTRLLIAEADAALAELYGRFLQTNGYDVALARDGLECWTVLHSERPPDILVLDWELPWGGGAGVLCRLHEDWADAMLPVVLTTTEDPTTDHFRRYISGVTACFQKPFSLAALMAALQRARKNSCNGFSRGTWLRITRGPFAGLQGRVLDASHESRVLLEIPSLGAGVYARVAAGALTNSDS